MIIFGDIACPNALSATQLDMALGSGPGMENKLKIGNLEGLIVDDDFDLESNEPILYNCKSGVDVLKRHSFGLLGLANNHTLDLEQNFVSTCEYLDYKGIKYIGAKTRSREWSNYINLSDGQDNVIVFNACWKFLLYHQSANKRGVDICLIKEIELLEEINKIRLHDKESTILVYLHWSFDLETLPFPMYRQWSKDLIDAGVNLVVGCHSHCVQGGEVYKNGYIVYGLGNFWIPNGVYANGGLKFPKMSEMQLALEYDVKTKKAICHWSKYVNNELEWLSSEVFEESNILKNFSPYQGMDSFEYLQYFAKNRRKKKGIPIFSNYRYIRTNIYYEYLLRIRAKVARTLAKRGMIKWQS
jgi:hypothetical protein